MRSFLTIIFTSLLLIPVAAQVKIQIVVTNEKNELINHNINLLDTLGKRVYETSSNDGGYFLLNVNTNYRVNISATDIDSFSRVINSGFNDTTLLFKIRSRATNLQMVLITAKKPLIKQDDDKTVVDAEALASSSTNAYEVLEKTPGLIVDQDGNIYLNSATPAQVQVNGKEVKLSTADIASLLKSLPSNSIVRIEILRTPSAKYDAASSGGIINIVLKKGVKLGTSGSLNANFFQGKYSTKSVGITLNRNAGKITSFLNYQFTVRNNYERLQSNRIISHTNIEQRSFTIYPSETHYLSTGIEYALRKSLAVGFESRFSSNKNNTYADNKVRFTEGLFSTVTAENSSVITNTGSTFYFTNNIYSRLKIDSMGSDWRVSLDYTSYCNYNDQIYRNQYISPSSDEHSGKGSLKSNKGIFVFQTDVVIKAKSKIVIEAGAKLISSSSKNESLYFVDSGGGLRRDSFQTNRFQYSEQISSTYIQAAKTFAGFNLKPGVRFEITNIKGNQVVPFDTLLQIKRTDIFPFVFIRHDLFNIFGFKLSGTAIYRRSITRPYYEALNPYPKYIDQFLYEVGNPKLRPQFTTNFELNVMADQFPVFAMGINNINQIFTNVTYQDTATKIAYRTYDNLGNNKEFYLRIVGGVPPGKKYFFYTGLQYNHVDYKGIYQGYPLGYKRGTFTFFMYHNYKPSPTFNVSVNGFMRIRGLQNFYELKPFGQINITATQLVVKKKLSITLSINDILKTNTYNFALQQATIKANGNRANDSRRAGLTLRYNFGIKPKEEKQPLFETPKE